MSKYSVFGFKADRCAVLDLVIKGFSAEEGFDLGDIFSSFFGGGFGGSRPSGHGSFGGGSFGSGFELFCRD